MTRSESLPDTMLAWHCPQYGAPDVLELREVPVPQVGPCDVLVSVAATSVSSGDARLRAGRFPPGLGLLARMGFGWSGPRKPVLGTEIAGTVVAVGDRVTRCAPGDRVIAFPDLHMGAHAQFVALPPDVPIVAWPSALDAASAASLCFGGLTARHFLDRADLALGDRLLVIGASGSVGSAMVQLARMAGAEVDAVCSGANAAMVEALGVRRVYDYTLQDIAILGEQWDVIADCVAALDFARARPLLRDRGRYLAVDGGLRELLARRRGSHRILAGPAKSTPADLDALVAAATEGAFGPVIDSTFAFADLPAAHARVDTRRKRGNVVVMVDPASS